MPKIINLLSYNIAENIEQYIKTNNLKAGDKLPAERELAQKYNVTRITLKQGLQKLIDRGIIFNVRNTGYYVAASKITRSLENYFFPYCDSCLTSKNYSCIYLEDLSAIPDELYIHLSEIVCFENFYIKQKIEYIDELPISLTYIIQKNASYEKFFSVKKKPKNIVQRQYIRIFHQTEKEMKLLEISSSDSLLLIIETMEGNEGLFAVCASICVGTRTNLLSSLTIK